ncbi:DUF1800 domain-containing protein [Pseudonocardia sp. Cha107L01]|uniref:DUF1800 domain-containing protein n=1 Tax=Pseudonocardia sp. Cha107L01 TaxID=3457576 RepID=UPI00403E6691
MNPHSAISEQAAARRLVQRVGLGPRPGELAAAGFEDTLAALIGTGNQPDPGAAATPAPTFAPEARVRKSAGQAPRRAQRQELAGQAHQLGVWWLDRMAAVEAPFPERMTWFWHGHFATSVRKVKFAQLMYQQNDTLRRLGRGDFRTLAQAMIVDPAMLVWLDGGGNRVGRPNENLAREFMELFTLGVGDYSENDVRQAARALTGWRVNHTSDTATFAEAAHDPGPETVLGTSASYDAAGLVDLLLRQPAAPRYLAGRIWARFVSDTPPDPATLDRLVGAYGAHHDITALLAEAVRSPAFRDPASALVREPVLWLVGALRALRLPASALPEPALTQALTGLGQVPFTPPSVGGWPAGVPWLTTAAALTRFRCAQVLAGAGDITPVSATAPSGRIDATAALLGLAGFTDRTVAALRPLVNQPAALVGVALSSPEYTVSA